MSNTANKIKQPITQEAPQVDEASTYPLEVHFTDKALKFIRAAKMQNPQLLVNLEYERPVSMGCCGGGMSDPTPTVKARILDDMNPGDGFVKVESKGGIPTYLAKPLYDSASRSGGPLVVDVGGFIGRTIKLEGLNLGHLAGKNSREGSSCH